MWDRPVRSPLPRRVLQRLPCPESSPPGCPSLLLLLVWVSVSSLSPWLSDFHTVRFSLSYGCFLFLILLLSFFWLYEEAQCIYLYLHLGRKSDSVFLFLRILIFIKVVRGGVKQHLVVLICFSLTMNNVDHVFTYFLAIFTFYLEDCLSAEVPSLCVWRGCRPRCC